MKTGAGLEVIVGYVRDEHPTDIPMHSAERNAFRQFGDAVRAFSDDPGQANLGRYLAASRAVEESRRSRQAPAMRRKRSKSQLP